MEPEAAQAPARLELHIPWITFVKIFVAILIGCALYILGRLALLVFLALFLAVTLDAFVGWLNERGMKPKLSRFLVITSVVIAVSLCIALIIPVLIVQIDSFSHSLPQLREATLKYLPEGGTIRQTVERMLDSRSTADPDASIDHVVAAGSTVFGGISQTIFFLVVGLYLLVDGGKVYAWFLAFFSPLNRRKIRDTSEEISKVIFGYVAGQIITSVLVSIYSFAVLSWLHVPGALTLAILAGVFDVLPVLGFLISTVPAVLLAMSVSPQTGLTVLGLYVLFQAIETYFIVPKVYGQRLRLSTLTVLLGLSAGALLGGIPGVLAALPVIASYEAIEKIWLTRFLREGVAEKHEMQKDEEFGEKKS